MLQKKNGEDEIVDLNRKTNRLKIEQRKSGRGRNLEEFWLNRKEEEEREVTNRPQYSRINLEFMKIYIGPASWVFAFYYKGRN